MKVKLTAQTLRLVGKKINAEGQWTMDYVLNSWPLSRNGDRDLGIFEAVRDKSLPNEAARADRKDVRMELAVGAEGGVVPIANAKEFEAWHKGIEFTDEVTIVAPEPEPKPGKYITKWTAQIGDMTYGPFGTYTQAADFAHARLKPSESWTSGNIRVPVE